MPVDFSKYLETNKLVEGNTEFPLDGSKSITNTNALGDLVAKILQTSFPAYVNNTNTKVTADEPKDFYTTAEYGGLAGDTIKLGKVEGRITTFLDPKGAPKLREGAVGATSNDVIEALGVTMHELMHARFASSKVDSFGINLGKDGHQLLKDANEAGFPSLGSTIFYGDSLNEFLASAIPARQMLDRGMTPTGVIGRAAKMLPDLIKKYPWLNDYMNTYSVPETANSTIKSLPPTLAQKLKSYFNK